MQAKIITPRYWYSNKKGVVVEIKDCTPFEHLYLAKDESTGGIYRQILKIDVEIIETTKKP